MLKAIYKSILLKLELDKSQLQELKNRLIPENISVHYFVSGNKTCPNTTALSVKEALIIKNNNQSKNLLKKYDVTFLQLVFFI